MPSLHLHRHHKSSVHERKKEFQCNGCDSSFARNSHLKEHISSVHKIKKTFQCNKCSSSFARIGSFLNHVARIHKGKNSEIQSQLSCYTVNHENQTFTTEG